MTQRYEKRFSELQKRGDKGFIPFTVLGWPDADRCVAHVSAMLRAGVSALELGFPFSDPIADGPVIQRAAHQVLDTGFSVADAFKVLGRIRELDRSVPIGVLVYYNIVLAHGVQNFFKRCAEVGVDGVLIADLPVESVEEVLPFARQNDVQLIYLVSPVTTADRLESICKNAGGFLYLISRLGVTGTSERDHDGDSKLATVIQNVRALSSTPIYAGFGISTPAHAKAMFQLGVDGVITGSRVIEILQSEKVELQEAKLADFCRAMVDACVGSGKAQARVDAG